MRCPCGSHADTHGLGNLGVDAPIQSISGAISEYRYRAARGVFCSIGSTWVKLMDRGQEHVKSDSALRRYRKAMLPAPAVLSLLGSAYEPCAGFSNGCQFAVWNPAGGHVPRGFCGAIASEEVVRLVLVCAEPGDPHDSESHESDGSPAGYLASANSYAWECFATGKDLFHRNVRTLLDLCWPDSTFEDQMRKTWITDSVLCSAPKECGPVQRSMEQECATRFLVPQLGQFPEAVVIALGRKAERRLRRAGIKRFEYAYSVAPPAVITHQHALLGKESLRSSRHELDQNRKGEIDGNSVVTGFAPGRSSIELCAGELRD